MLGILPEDPAFLLRTVVVGIAAYSALVVLLRISGKRTLSSMNAFDFVVTVALGSTLATVLLSRDVSLAEGVLALALLIALQFVITWTSQRSHFVSDVVKAEPTALVYRGKLLPGAMKRERVVDVEIAAAVREQGLTSIDEADLVVLETDGTMSVVASMGSDRSGLKYLKGIPGEAGSGEKHAPG